MGLFSGMVKFGAAVGIGIFGAKVIEEINKENPNGIKDYNNDGKVDYRDYASAVSSASKTVYGKAKRSFADGVNKWASKDETKEAAEAASETAN